LIGGPPSAWALHWIERVSRANKPSVPKRVTCDINYLLEKSGLAIPATTRCNGTRTLNATCDSVVAVLFWLDRNNGFSIPTYSKITM
jgi:hypothetical protein